MRVSLSSVLTAGLLATALLPGAAEACGCFTPPDPTVPIVQAGERILFAVKDGHVTSHVQIQYSGSATDFGWLLPLPSVPSLELGTDELFTQLYATTQPEYRMALKFDPQCTAPGPINFGTGGGGGGGFADAGAASPQDGGSPSVLVIQDSIGPYDYAVLKADSKDAMLGWLADNHYFVPVGTTDSVAPYIHAGGFFLALKLKSGSSTGDLQPIVLKYASDVGMIPITLTSTGATENMGVQVWMLGTGRAIPRNYNHTVLNDAAIDWQQRGANYNAVVIRAVGEAPEKHSFVTEFSGPSRVMLGALGSSTRFGSEADLAGQPTASAFVRYLYAKGFGVAPPRGMFSSQPILPGQLKAILAKFLPPPPGVNAEAFYRYFDSYQYQAVVNYQPVEMARQIWARMVVPTRDAAALFEASPTLTRLYTTISPIDMNRDPVFAFNPTLPAVANVHEATMQVSCDAHSHLETGAVLSTEQGNRIEYPNTRFSPPAMDPLKGPASLRIEVLREEGQPVVVMDNTPPEMKTPVKVQVQGCSAVEASFALGALVPLLLRRMRRKVA